RRRPRGNLVAQSLAAHGGQWWAPTLRSRRITRIAVLPDLRQQGIAKRLIEQQKQRSQGLDFLSVSFGYTEPLWRFWQSCGFTLVRVGNKPEASSGCYTAMGLLPLNEQGKALCHVAHKRLARDWRWLQQRIDLQPAMAVDDSDPLLNEEDWRELAGFAFAHRPLEASLGALQRLLLITSWPMAALRSHLQQQRSLAQCVAEYGFSGQKALLRQWRQEVAQALEHWDSQRCHHWQRWSRHWQFGSLFNLRSSPMKHEHFVVQSPATPAEQLILLFHGVGDNPVAMGEIGSYFAKDFPQALVVSIGGPFAFGQGNGRQWFSVQGVTEANRAERIAEVMPTFVATVRYWQ
uniref:N-acetyltransferase domain-containing protein n=1 Tax=Anopheles maculatus TaxID=74869 RepID=A0A182T4D1_9DIPT